jgi:ubiquinone/menaquinone biosynthesis C-methylase UbiE
VLDLGFHPLADFFLKPHQMHEAEQRYPLAVLLCDDCGHGMNSFVVSGETRYQENDYSYDSSNSKIAVGHFNSMASEVASRAGLEKGDLVVDIGSNIGTLLSAFKELGADIQGVDPAHNIAALAEKNGIPTINDFFGDSAAQKILARGKAKVVTITNAFNHVSDLDAFMKALSSVLRDDGMFVIELPYFLEILRKKHFDVIYLEHVSYIAVRPLREYLKKFGLTIMHVEENGYMSGSARFYIGKGSEDDSVEQQIALENEVGLYDVATWKHFADEVLQMKLNLLEQLVAARKTGAKIVAIGAAAKGNTLLNYCGIDRALIDFATDASPLKVGKFTPGSHLEIFEDSAIDDSVTHALILAWNIADFLKGKIGPKHPNLQFITPHVVETK